jgi:putative restriction endonuclease
MSSSNSSDNIPIGTTFAGRRELHDAGIHRGLMRGIAPEGLSIVLSGGYVDDQDLGDEIIYTGEGGRDSKTGRQIADQTLTGGNLHLAQNCQRGIPVRVSRGFKSESDFKPKTGYRYDGHYRIEEYWSKTGKDGFLIWRYRLFAIPDEAVLFEESGSISSSFQKPPEGSQTPSRRKSSVCRVVRNTAVGEYVKALYDHSCQRCGVRIDTPAGPYAECCHIRGLGKPHNGPDVVENVLCLCPNCHVEFDYHVWHISDDLCEVETGRKLTVSDDHKIDLEHVRYHLDKLAST